MSPGCHTYIYLLNKALAMSVCYLHSVFALFLFTSKSADTMLCGNRRDGLHACCVISVRKYYYWRMHGSIILSLVSTFPYLCLLTNTHCSFFLSTWIFYISLIYCVIKWNTEQRWKINRGHDYISLCSYWLIALLNRLTSQVQCRLFFTAQLFILTQLSKRPF